MAPVQVVAAAEAEAMPWDDAEAEVVVGREAALDASGLVAVAETGTQAAWIVYGCPASLPARYQDAEGSDSGMAAGRMLEVEDAASAPALQLEGCCRKADSACRHKSAAAAVLGYAVGGQVGRGSSLCGGDVLEGVEGAAADAALDAVKCAKTVVIFLAAVVRDRVGSVASRRWA